jgi:type III secretory pathway lipoprotein EscJ
MLSKCTEWFEGQDEANAMQILLLRKVWNIAAQKARASKKQKKMTDYFKI